MLSIVNTLLISITIIVTIYVILNIKDNINVFTGIYNDEQDNKHKKLEQTFNKLSKNDNNLKKKSDEHTDKIEKQNSQLLDHADNIRNNEDRLVVNNTLLQTHENKLNNPNDIIIKDKDGVTDYSQQDVYSLIGHNNRLINDNYTKVFNVLESTSTGESSTRLRSEKASILMDNDGNVKINVLDRDKLKLCDENGTDCSQIVTREYIDKLPIVNSNDNSIIV
jgi:hypothetical protein